MMKPLTVGFAALALACAASAATFTGTITDDMCVKDHSSMKMGSDAKCVTECVKTMNAKYALFDGKNAYVLSDQKAPAKFAGQKVTVTGTLDDKTKTLKVDQIAAAK
jgi:phosphate-selective porin